MAAGAALDFAHETAESTSHTFDLNQIRYKSGAISEVDLSRTETAKLEADQAVDAATLALRAAKVQLAFLLGQRHAFTTSVIDASQLRYAMPAALSNATVASLVDRAIETRPDLRAQENQRARAAQAVALAKRQRFPDFGLNVQYSEQGSGNALRRWRTRHLAADAGDLADRLAAALLPAAGRDQEGARPTRARRTRRRAKLRAQVVADVENAFAGYQTAQARCSAWRGACSTARRRARELVQLQYQKGAASLLEYLDAQRTYIATKGEYIQDLTAYWNAIFQLEAATATQVTP